jgi:hypothetical protein
MHRIGKDGFTICIFFNNMIIKIGKGKLYNFMNTQSYKNITRKFIRHHQSTYV